MSDAVMCEEKKTVPDLRDWDTLLPARRLKGAIVIAGLSNSPRLHLDHGAPQWAGSGGCGPAVVEAVQAALGRITAEQTGQWRPWPSLTPLLPRALNSAVGSAPH